MRLFALSKQIKGGNMNDKEAFEAVRELVSTILLECQRYALNDGIDPLFVIKTVGTALVNLAESKTRL